MNENFKNTQHELIKDRIEQLLYYNLLTQEELCNSLNINRPNFSNQLNVNNNKGIPFETIVSIANYFNISPGYIMGYTDKKNENDNKYRILDNISNLQVLLSMLQISSAKQYLINYTFNTRLYELYLIYYNSYMKIANNSDLHFKMHELLKQLNIDIYNDFKIFSKKDYKNKYQNDLITITINNELLNNKDLFTFLNNLYTLETPNDLIIQDISTSKVINTNISWQILDIIENNISSVYELLTFGTFFTSSLDDNIK